MALAKIMIVITGSNNCYNIGAQETDFDIWKHKVAR